ncbi:MAG: MFS transporter [Candidatus Brocadiia bacterium]|jgi:predicted MFS family arabinose efflux permease|nr:MFS transporter [Candidatus Brocadiia bacterium]
MLWPLESLLRRLTDDPQQRRNILWMLVASFLASAGGALSAGAVRQNYLLYAKLTLTHIGIIGSISGIAGAVGLFALVGVPDRIERRVRAWVILALFPALTPLVLALLSLRGLDLRTANLVFWALVAMMLLNAPLESLQSMVMGSVTVRIVHVRVRGRAWGLSGLAAGLAGIGFGLLAGRILATVEPPARFTLCFGLAPAFFIAAALSRLGFRELPELQGPSRSGSAFPWTALRDVWRLKQFRILFVPTLLRGLTSAFPFFAWLVAKERLNLPDGYAGLVVMVNALGGTILGHMAVGLLADRWGPGWVTFTGYALTAAVLLGLVFTDSGPVFLVLYGVLALGGSLIGVAVPLGTLEIAPPELVGAFNGARLILNAAGAAVSMALVGFLLESLDPLHVFAGGAVLSLVNGIWYWHGFRRRA